MTIPLCSSFRLTPVLALLASAAIDPAEAAPDAAVAWNGLEWASESNGADVTWTAADAFCRDLVIDGRGDWRLPTLDELEGLHDPEQPDGIRPPLRLDGCCLWSTTSLEERPAEDAGDIGADASRYRWGFLFDGGIRYYSIELQPDGRALCVRERE